ncbi:MAG: hypothetical protein LC734_10745, partial [Acidobacteria bacterium]|nr:hypothetical protein [Acidobacteriota bacterium]
MRKIFPLFCLLFLTSGAPGFDPEIWSVNTRSEILRGDARGVSIDANGTITLAPRFAEVYRTEQPFIWSSAADTSGNIYLGTGGEGRIFRVSANGAGALLTDLAELNVSALAIGRSGELFGATSPNGKVYRIDSAGKSEVYFDPKEKYIWSLAAMADGGLAVGTGDNGRIYIVRSANAAPDASLLFDTSETHIITLAADRQGNLFAGTDSSGLVLRFGPDRRPFALLDSPLREIHSLKLGPDGSLYALAIGESASAQTPQPAPAATATPEIKTVAAGKPNPLQPEPPPKSRYDLTGAKSAVYRILPDGGSDILWSSQAVTGFSLHAHQAGNGVLLGTSDKGRIYNITNDARETLVLQSDASQVSTLLATGVALYATSSNQGRLYRIGGEPPPDGTYESSVLDARAAADWGNIWWSSAGNVTIETRSGNSEVPNQTWSAWELVRGESSRGRVPSPKSRFFQWRAVLKGGPTTASLSEVNVAYLPRNIAPEILSIQVLPTNVGLIPNPAPQIDPNIELSGVDPAIFGVPSIIAVPRRVYQRSARSLQWTAEDRNGDKLVYDIYYKESADSAFKLLKENVAENFYTIDGQTLADGRYTVKIVARDSVANSANRALSGERVSEPFDIDNGQPTVSAVGQPQMAGERVRVVFTASERSSYIARAEFSVNGGEWRSVNPDDGIADGPEERFTLDVPLRTPGEYSITLRVFDANGNSG